MGLKELITNDNGRLSTTGTIQFGGALLMAIILAICVYLDRSVNDLHGCFLAVSK